MESIWLCYYCMEKPRFVNNINHLCKNTSKIHKVRQRIYHPDTKQVKSRAKKYWNIIPFHVHINAWKVLYDVDKLTAESKISNLLRQETWKYLLKGNITWNNWCRPAYQIVLFFLLKTYFIPTETDWIKVVQRNNDRHLPPEHHRGKISFLSSLHEKDLH